MSDPKHPVKVVIVVKGGVVNNIFIDKQAHIRFFVADYDADGQEGEVDMRGDYRKITEESAWLDTPECRAVLNKKGGKKDGTVE